METLTMGAWIWWALAVGSAVSLGVRRPWTSYLSRGRYLEQVRAHPWFREANQVITGGWTAYFFGAAVLSMLGPAWVSIALSLPTPVLGWLSFLVGDRYVPWRMRRSETKGDASMTNPAQAELRVRISGRTDDEIVALVHEAPGGIEAILDQTVVGMTDAFDADAAQDCVIGYEIVSDDAIYPCRIEVQGRQFRAERRQPSDARVVLQLSLPEYLRLITGLLDGMDAFMSGRMKIRGDVMFAPQIARMFRTA
jgi:putative sterol carrier protein